MTGHSWSSGAPSSGSQHTGRGGSRRSVLVGCAAACSVSVLGGCASYGDPTQAEVEALPAAGGPPAASGTVPATASATASAPATPATSAGPVLAALDDIPVGGAVILADEGLVLTRPGAGTVRAYSSTCTHAGCAVTTVRGSTVGCPCHGSRFRLSDGSVAAGPASAPLDVVAVAVEGGQVRRA